MQLLVLRLAKDRKTKNRKIRVERVIQGLFAPCDKLLFLVKKAAGDHLVDG